MPAALPLALWLATTASEKRTLIVEEQYRLARGTGLSEEVSGMRWTSTGGETGHDFEFAIDFEDPQTSTGTRSSRLS